MSYFYIIVFLIFSQDGLCLLYYKNIKYFLSVLLEKFENILSRSKKKNIWNFNWNDFKIPPFFLIFSCTASRFFSFKSFSYGFYRFIKVIYNIDFPLYISTGYCWYMRKLIEFWIFVLGLVVSLICSLTPGAFYLVLFCF